MISLITRSLRSNIFTINLTLEESKTFIFRNYKNINSACIKGYVLTCHNKNKNPFCETNKKEVFGIETLNIRVRRRFSTEENIQLINFDKVSTETLESLSEKFDEIIEETTHLQEADVSYGDGVLTIKFGHDYGTYVINRQIPNQQIWLSSPTSGPKRYDFINGSWIYKHDGRALHELLNEEISNIVKSSVSFDECSYSVKAK